MTAKKTNLLKSAGVAAVLSLLMASCATVPPPTEELDAARIAIANAENVDAAQYAPQQLSEARSLFNAANDALNKGNDTDARPLLEKSIAMAELASAQAVAAVKVNDAQARQKQVQDLRRKIQQVSP